MTAAVGNDSTFGSDASKDIIAVVGPNGSGKTSAIYETQVGKDYIFINPDDIARRDFSHIADKDERDLLAWESCNHQREILIASGKSFGFETVGSHISKVELLQEAKRQGYTVILLFVATETPEINIKRIQYRVAQGGHGVPDDKVRSRYERTLRLLPEYFAVADYATIWDNSQENTKGASKELLRKDIDGTITIFPEADDVNWIQRYLIDTLPK
jgi:predicted ABC-type ATPase